MTVVNLNEQMAHLACTKAAAQGGYGVRQSNPPSFIELQTRNRTKAWDGTLTVLITPSGSGSEITVNYSIAKSDFKVGVMAVAEATGAASMASARLNVFITNAVAELEHAAKTSVESTPNESQESIRSVQQLSVADEIMKLKSLLDAGVLTSDEFKTLKSRLLD